MSEAMELYKQGLAKHPGGRPPIWTDDVIPKSINYIQNYKSLGDKVPSIVGLAQVLETSRQRLYEWAKDEEKPEFRYMLDVLSTGQEHKLINGGLSGELNSALTKLLLGKHGYHDKQEVTSTVVVTKIERVIIDIPQGVTVEHES